MIKAFKSDGLFKTGDSFESEGSLYFKNIVDINHSTLNSHLFSWIVTYSLDYCY
jgi:hypothetical protein